MATFAWTVRRSMTSGAAIQGNRPPWNITAVMENCWRPLKNARPIRPCRWRILVTLMPRTESFFWPNSPAMVRCSHGDRDDVLRGLWRCVGLEDCGFGLVERAGASSAYGAYATEGRRHRTHRSGGWLCQIRRGGLGGNVLWGIETRSCLKQFIFFLSIFTYSRLAEFSWSEWNFWIEISSNHQFLTSNGHLVVWLIDWLIDRLIDWGIDWSIDWLGDWWIDWWIDWLIKRHVFYRYSSFILELLKISLFLSNYCLLSPPYLDQWKSEFQTGI